MKEMTLKEIQNLLGYEVKIIADEPVKKLADVAAGKTFKIGNLEFIVLQQIGDKTCVLLKDFWKTDRFDNKSNNYANSEIRTKLNKDFYNEIRKYVYESNIILHEVDLTSDDGRRDYGLVKDYVSLLTCDMYRQYVDIIDKYRITSDWWWTATPYSTESNGYNSDVRCVDYGGTLYFSNCYYVSGVRPFCILKSNIFVS